MRNERRNERRNENSIERRNEERGNTEKRKLKECSQKGRSRQRHTIIHQLRGRT